jgi:hypothetical protein
MALRNRSDQKGCPQPALQSLENQSRFSAFWLIKKELLSDRRLGGMMVTQKRVAIYARVSTVDKGQDPETQLGPNPTLTLLANSYKCPTRTIGGHNGVYWIYNRLPH